MSIMSIPYKPCNPANHGGHRDQPIEYIVIHYTAGFNDTAWDNGTYFGRAQVGASAHYFVDEFKIVQSVPDDVIAWHCGGAHYKHPRCRNSNSIGVEICSKYNAGVYSFAPAAVKRAQDFVQVLMKKYNIPVENVIRHYDVTGKVCPAPFVLEPSGAAAWAAFKAGLRGEDEVRYNTIEELPDWGVPTITKLVEAHLLQGDNTGLDLSRDMLRLLVILDRAGFFSKAEPDSST